MESAAGVPGPIAIRAVVGERRVPEEVDGAPLAMDERGRVEEDAILGRAGALFRVVFKAPEARFLFLMTSVFRESGRVMPCSL